MSKKLLFGFFVLLQGFLYLIDRIKKTIFILFFKFFKNFYLLNYFTLYLHEDIREDIKLFQNSNQF